MGKKNQKKIETALKKVGGKLNLAEIERIKRQTGVKGGIAPIAKKLGIELSYGVKNRGNQSNIEVPGFEGYSFGEEFTPAVFDYQSALNLVNAQGNIDTKIAGINSEASKYIAKLNVGSAKEVAQIGLEGTKYTADKELEGILGSARLGLEGTKYKSDRELEGVLGAENIRAKGAIDLQKIVNTGMKDVEKIRGEYGVKGKKIDRSTAVMAGLVNAFSF